MQRDKQRLDFCEPGLLRRQIFFQKKFFFQKKLFFCFQNSLVKKRIYGPWKDNIFLPVSWCSVKSEVSG